MSPIDIVHQFLQHPIGLLYVIILLGVFVGRIPLGPVKLGASGIMLIGLIVGHLGFQLPKIIQTLGIVLFVYSVGLKAGPHIMESFKKSKGTYFGMACLIVGTGALTCWVLRLIFNVDAALLVGIYAGAMTSTPALAAAMETVANSTPSIGYGFAYPIGILGVIFSVQVIPYLLKVNFKEEDEKYLLENPTKQIEQVTLKVTNPNIAEKPVSEVFEGLDQGYRLVRVKRGDQIFTPQGDDALMVGDTALIVGDPKMIKQLTVLIGHVVDEIIEQTDSARSRWIVISSRQFIGRKIGHLEVSSLYGVVISRVKRSDIEIIPTHDFAFEAGDEVRVSGSPDDLARFTKIVGMNRETLYETDYFSHAAGLVLGIILGLIKIPINDQLSLGFGIAGGPLIAGLIFGHVGRFGNVTGYMPRAAQELTGTAGLYFFLAVAGCTAGASFAQIFHSQGLILIVCAFLLMVMPVLLTIILGRFLFKMNVLVLLGMLCGGMTSTPGLGILTTNTKSNVPAIAYTGIYPIAVVFTALAAQILVLF